MHLKTLFYGLTVLGFASEAVSAQKAGLAFGIDHEFITYATNTLGPDLIDLINGIEIPDSTLADGSYFKNFKVVLNKGETKDFAVNFCPKNQALDLDLSNVDGSVHGDFKTCYLKDTLGCLTGKIAIDIKKPGFQLTTDLVLAPGTSVHGRSVPLVSLTNFDSKLSPDDVDIKLTGEFGIETIADLLIPFVKETLIP